MTFRTLAAVLLVVASVVADAESRLRIDNTGGDGRVRIVQSDETVRTVTVSMPGLVSGEIVTVEAPARQVRLKGGSIGIDPLLEAVVELKRIEATGRGPTVSVLPEPPRFALEPRSYANHVFTDAAFAYGPGYRTWSGDEWRGSSRRHHEGSTTTVRRPAAPPAPAPRGTRVMRGVMPGVRR